MKDGIILFAHGSREPEWAQPLESIARQLSGQFIVEMAYLERMVPTLDEAVDSVVAKGARRVRIVPVFLGVGGHLKKDLPRLVEAARARHAGLEIVLEQTIGERKEITDAIAAVISKGISHQAR